MLSYSEQQHIHKYRSLDEHGRETVDVILERENIRSRELQKKEARIRELEEKRSF